jgi:hypothetical protein
MLDRSGDSSGLKWRGRVVNVMDPKMQGRFQVRVFGKQDDQALIPDKDLFWAIPKVPLTHGASLKGVGSSPVGVVPGSIVEGYYADTECTILVADGTLLSAGSTKPGQTIDGSYAIDSSTNDMAMASREQDLNSALGGKNLTALAANGLKFASLSAGVGVLSSVPSNLTSTMMRLDPSNMSGSLSGALVGVNMLQAIDSFSTPGGLIEIGAAGITRILATSMQVIGVAQTMSLVNSIDPNTLSPETLGATNAALSNITTTFQSGSTNPLSTLAAPAFDPNALSFLDNTSYAAESASLMNQMSSVASISDVGSLGGIESISNIPGAVIPAQCMISDVAAAQSISSASAGFNNSANLVSSLDSVISAVRLGGINMLFGSGITSLNQISSIAPSIVPSLSFIVNSASNITGLNSFGSAFGIALNTLNTTDILLGFMINSLKKKATSKATLQESPPEPEQSVTTDSVASTTPASSTKPAIPVVGNADPSALEAQILVGENQIQDTGSVTNYSFYEGSAGQQETINADTENENIMKQIGKREDTQQAAALESRNTISDAVAERAARRKSNN